MRLSEGELANLAALAEKATPGERQVIDRGDDGLVSSRHWQGMRVAIAARPKLLSADEWQHDAAFIAAANPETIKALLADIEELKAALKPFAAGSMDVSGTAVIGATRDDLTRLRAALSSSLETKGDGAK